MITASPPDGAGACLQMGVVSDVMDVDVVFKGIVVKIDYYFVLSTFGIDRIVYPVQ